MTSWTQEHLKSLNSRRNKPVAIILMVIYLIIVMTLKMIIRWKYVKQKVTVLSFSFLSNATTCPYELRGFSSWLWRECSRLLRLGCPWGAATLPQWCEWWYVYEDEVPGWVLKSKSTNYPDHVHHGDLPLPGKIPILLDKFVHHFLKI